MMTKTKFFQFIFMGLGIICVSNGLAQDYGQSNNRSNPQSEGQSQKEINSITDVSQVDVEILFSEGINAFRASQWAVAENKFLQTVKLEKSSVPDFAYYFLGLTQQQLGKDKEAIESYSALADFKSNFKLKIDAQYRVANLYLKSRNFISGRSVLQKLERRLRGEELYPEVLMLLVQAELGNKKPQIACRWAKKLYSKYPMHPLTVNWTLDLNEVEVDGKKLGCAVDDEDFSNRVRYLQLSGNSEKAKKEIETLQKRSGQAHSLSIDRIWAQYYVQESEPYEALQLLLKYYPEEKNKFDYLMSLAVAASRSGEAPMATGLYYSAYKLQPKSKDGLKALYNAAFLSYQFQDYDGATRKYAELLDVAPRSSFAMESLWHLAWLKYLKSDYVGAELAFKDLAQKRARHPRRYTFPADRSKYWLAMSLLRQGRIDEAKNHFEDLVKLGQLNYYSVAAFHRLESLGGPRFLDLVPVSNPVADSEESVVLAEKEEGSDPSSANTESTPEVQDSALSESEDSPRPERNSHIVDRLKRVERLEGLGLTEWSKWELYEIEKRTSDPKFLRDLIAEYIKVGSYNRASYIGQVYFALERARLGFKGAKNLWEATYPQAYKNFVVEAAAEFSIEPEFIWSIMRAESVYKRDVVSPVGAIGLMQVMPFTGARVASSIGIKQFQTEMLFDPEVIIRIGGKYLQHLSRKFERSLPLAAAAYNAGPHRVSQWLYSFGYLEMDEFIEHIPFQETRNYVKKVLSNYVIYKRLYTSEREESQILASVVPVYLSEPPALKETWGDL